MVAFGPWVQDADYPTTWAISDSGTPPHYELQAVSAVDESGFQDPVYPILDTHLAAVLDSARSQVPSGVGGFVDELTSGYELSFPNWNSGWRAKVWDKSFTFTTPDHQYNPPNHGSLPPEGAIGIDYQGQPYSPGDPWAYAGSMTLTMQLAANTTLEGKFEDGRRDPGELLPWASLTRLMITVDQVKLSLGELGSAATDTTPNWANIQLGEPIDLTAFATASRVWTAKLHTETPNFIVGGNPAPYASTRTRYGWLLKTLHFEAQLRPPLYRWVYANTPYRRTFPRDDGLAGGAGRNYPPSRASQSSNRTSGYL